MVIQTPTPAIEKSLDFYDKLEFTHFERDTRHFVTDGNVTIEVVADRFARAGIQLYADNWDNEVDALRSLTKVVESDERFVFTDHSGTRVYLVYGEEPHLADGDEKKSLLGNYAGTSLEMLDAEGGCLLYEKLGFKKSMGDLGQGWVAYSGFGGGVSIMCDGSCPHLFFNPSLTYFNSGKNLEVIENIRNVGVAFTEEITYFSKANVVDNAIVRDPGGLGFFIFND